MDSKSGNGRDVVILFITRATRMFAYGFLSVVLVLYLSGLGFPEGRIGLLLTLALLGSVASAHAQEYLEVAANPVGAGKGKKIVLVAGDEEYRTEEGECKRDDEHFSHVS
ncbi:MAG: hypothetical protein WCL50_03530, partial [Spirochaetota bacterium]